MLTPAHIADLHRLIAVASSMVVETDLATVLDRIVQAAGQSLGLERNSILLLDAETGLLNHGAARGLPDDYVAILNGIPIGPSMSTCGVAATPSSPAIY